jgi:mannose-6-phosphate isomerase
MDLLQPVVRPYAWGSRRGIAELQGRPFPTEGPEAELWMGAHPSAPSVVCRNGRRTTLEAVIAADPVGELGPACVARFGTRLPFLLKVLSAEVALSIQLHPSRVQAEAGFRAENERGLPPGDPARNYVDDWPKPELLCALTPFEVLAGLRTPKDAAGLLRALDVDQVRPLAAGLEGAVGEQVPAEALASILEWPEPGRAELIGAVLAACASLASADGPYRDACQAAVRESANHPGDLGLVAMLLMRHTVLQPGQALFMPAGGLHAYLRGTGAELLANSDNVIRAGLTRKHVDVPELLTLLDPDARVAVILPRPLAEGVEVYETPAPEFRLYQLDLPGGRLALPGSGPRILLCTEGSVVLRGESGQVSVARGESCFVSAADGVVTGTGQARAVLAGVGEPS